MSVNPQTTGYHNWHIADTGNGKGVRLCCFVEVAWVKNAFCKHGIQLDLVFGVGEDDLLCWSLISGVSLYTRLDPDLCVLVKVLMMLEKYLSNTRMTFARRRARWTNALKASTKTRSLPDGQLITQRSAYTSYIMVSEIGQLRSDIVTCSLCFSVDLH